MALIPGVVNEVPVPSDVPPEEAAYQLRVPALAVAPRVTVPDPQRDAGVVDVTDGVVFIVATTEVLEEVQFAVAAST